MSVCNPRGQSFLSLEGRLDNLRAGDSVFGVLVDLDLDFLFIQLHSLRNVMNVLARQTTKQLSQLIYEDKAVVVVNKFSGLICQSDRSSSRVSSSDLSF